MSDYLAAEPQADADAVFRNFMRYNIARATGGDLDVLRSEPDLSVAWWSDLRRCLETHAVTSTERTHADQERVTDRTRGRFGGAVDTR